MEEKTWVHPDLPGHEFDTVTLKKGEYHECKRTGYVSRGPGHVTVDDHPQGMTTWVEYDLNAPKYVAILNELKEKGWLVKTGK